MPAVRSLRRIRTEETRLGPRIPSEPPVRTQIFQPPAPPAALEAAAAILTVRDGVLPPTAYYRMPDPECDLDVVPNRARSAQVEYALSNSFAFGGLNAVLAFRKV